VIVVLASQRDDAARALLARWSAVDLALLTPDDLSQPGWRYRPGRPDEGVAIVSGQAVETRRISGVATLLWAVGEDHLERIVPGERAFVAAEMTAFLVAWLADLPCPVVNRPTAGCLMGPNWSPEQWRLAAGRAGCRLADPSVDGAAQSTLTVVRPACLGRGHPHLRRAARRLAREAGVECLDVTFTGAGRDARFVCASLTPDVSDPAVADALLDRLRPPEAQA
jgi:hypothetical protein